MTFLAALEVFNYGLVLIYGLFLSTLITGGWGNRRQEGIVFALCLVLLMGQGVCWLILGVHAVKQLYPVIVHLPLALTLIFALKKRAGVVLVSVCTAYLCCQLPRWVKLMVMALSGSGLVGEISYTLSIAPIFFLLYRFFVRAAHDAMTSSRQSLLLFGSLPVAYYFFDYATGVYSEALHISVKVLNEFLPTALIVFYVLFLAAYHAQAQKRAQAELQRSMLEAELKQAGVEMEGLRRSEMQAAIYQHDIRHHMAVIEGFLAADKIPEAEEYIKKVCSDVEAVIPKRFCENETVNLLCSSYADKAERMGIRLEVEARLPKSLSVSDTELCSLLSNGLENALYAVRELEQPLKWVEFYCGVRLNKLLIDIRNPYAGQIDLRDGLPVSERVGHGYGCRSIRAITQQHRGLCTFEPENGIFTLRVILPVCGDGPQK